MTDRDPPPPDDFETADDLVAWLAETGKCDVADVRLLVEGMLAADWDGRRMTPEGVCNKILEFGLLYRDAPAGWVTREGKMHSAVWGAHERLLDWMGLETPEVERLGWARVTPHNWACQYRLTREQKRRVEECGKLVDDREERNRPVWTPPEDMPTASPGK